MYITPKQPKQKLIKIITSITVSITDYTIKISLMICLFIIKLVTNSMQIPKIIIKILKIKNSLVSGWS